MKGLFVFMEAYPQPSQPAMRPDIKVSPGLFCLSFHIRVDGFTGGTFVSVTYVGI